MAVEEKDYEGPPEDSSWDWYMKYRLDEQKIFYSMGQKKNEAAVRRHRMQSLAFAILAAVLVVLASFFDNAMFAPLIAASTTIAAALAAFGLMERRQFLAASYGAMADQIGSLKMEAAAKGFGLADIVAAGEDLLTAENRAWASRLAEKPFVPPTTSSEGADTAPGGAGA